MKRMGHAHRVESQWNQMLLLAFAVKSLAQEAFWAAEEGSIADAYRTLGSSAPLHCIKQDIEELALGILASRRSGDVAVAASVLDAARRMEEIAHHVYWLAGEVIVAKEGCEDLQPLWPIFRAATLLLEDAVLALALLRSGSRAEVAVRGSVLENQLRALQAMLANDPILAPDRMRHLSPVQWHTVALLREMLLQIDAMIDDEIKDGP
jgi:hypothetical protein